MMSSLGTLPGAGQSAFAGAASARDRASGSAPASSAASGRITVVNLSVTPLIEPPRQPAPTTAQRSDITRAPDGVLLLPAPLDPHAPAGPPPAFEQTYLERRRMLALRLVAALHAEPQQGDARAPDLPERPVATRTFAPPGDASAREGLLVLRQPDMVVPPRLDRKA